MEVLNTASSVTCFLSNNSQRVQNDKLFKTHICCLISANGCSSPWSFSTRKLCVKGKDRKLVIVEAKKKKKSDSHSFIPKPDEATGPFPEAVLLKEKKVQEDGRVLPEFADADEEKMFDFLSLQLESDLNLQQMRHYEVVYLIHEDHKEEVGIVNTKVEGSHIFLFNPITQEKVTVQATPQDLRCVFCAFYFHPTSKEYRILFYHYPTQGALSLNFQVLSLATKVSRQITTGVLTHPPIASSPPIILDNGNLLGWSTTSFTKECMGSCQSVLSPFCPSTWIPRNFAPYPTLDLKAINAVYKDISRGWNSCKLMGIYATVIFLPGRK